jgi:initiation factor 1A
MSKVNKGGSKHRKQKKVENIGKRELIVKEEENERFGVVLSALGGCRFSVLCDDNITRVCKLGNTLKKQVDIYVGLLVMIAVISEGTSEESDKKGFIIHGYTNREAKKLVKMDVLTNKEIISKLNVHISTAGEDDAVEFGYEEEPEVKKGYINGKLVELSSDEEEDDKKDDDFDIDDI